MANPATPHPVLNPPPPAPAQPQTLTDQLAAYNITPATVAGQVAPKVVGMAIIWIGGKIFGGLFK